MQKKNCFTSVICALVFFFFLLQCNALTETAAYWPRMICIVGLVLAGLEIAIEGFKWSKAAGEQEALFPLNGAQAKRALILLGLLLLWIAGLTTIGFLVSSVLALCAISIIFDPDKSKKSILRNVIVCVIFGMIIYFTFKFLGIHFPRTLLM